VGESVWERECGFEEEEGEGGPGGGLL